ncbi:MAG: EAL domain-containing protein [Hyphomicrobiales bacterium]|nr:EAL domain-containing protein [Hyphomicrobiales bacterium]
MADAPPSMPPVPSDTRRRLPRIEPALRAPLISTVVGLLAGVGLAMVLPAAFALPAAIVVLALSGLSAMLALDTVRRRQAEALARNVGELNVRLGATRIKLEGLQSRINSEPLREADIAPTRLALSELTAEVGLLGGVLRDVATAVSEHERRIADQEEARSPAGRPNPGGVAAKPAAETASQPVLTAEPVHVVDADMVRREQARLQPILDAFEAGGVEVHLQPIAALPHRRTVGYEVLARLRLGDGALLLPAQFIPAIERAGQAASLDAQVLTQSLAIAGHLNAKGTDEFLSINLTPSTWAEARSLGSIARVLETYQRHAARLVIDIPQRIFRQLDPTRLGIIGAISAKGIRFSVDQVADLRMDPASLSERGVRFVKLPTRVLAGEAMGSAGLDVDMADVALLMRRAGIEIIGEQAESDRQVADLLELDVRLAQGLAISAPRPVRSDVFQSAAQQASRPPAEPAPVEPAAPPALPRPEPEAERIPFRATLRRASA